MHRTLLIGDIHGCYRELLNLLDQAGLTADDRVIALGDIVDRGHDTPAVIDFFRARWDSAQFNARSLLGNHERKHLRWSRGELKPALSQVIARKQLGAAYNNALALFDTLPAYLELPEANLVHGYLEPDVPLEQQRITVLTGTRSGESYLTAHYDRPWYELYAGQKPVIFGHDDLLHNGQPFVYQDRIIGLDTSCVLGKRLTGLLLPDFRFISVPAEDNHWYTVRKAYAPRSPTTTARKAYDAPSTTTWEDEQEAVLTRLLDYCFQETARILADLNAQPDFADLIPRQQALAYAQHTKDSPAVIYLQLARRGALTRDAASHLLHNAKTLQELINRLGLDPV